VKAVDAITQWRDIVREQTRPSYSLGTGSLLPKAGNDRIRRPRGAGRLHTKDLVEEGCNRDVVGSLLAHRQRHRDALRADHVP
jgi:hypothetical protein